MKYRLFALIAVVFALCGAMPLHSETPTPPPEKPAVEAPAGDSKPGEPKPGESAPPAVAPKKKEDETDTTSPETQSSTNPAPRAGLGTRVSAVLSAMKGSGAAVQQLADRDRTIADLRSQLKQAQTSLNTVTSERDSARQELSKIESALQTLEGERRTVEETVASLGFEPRKLPPQNSAEAPDKKTWEISSDESNAKALQNLGFSAN